jgi:hypothetical protein
MNIYDKEEKIRQIYREWDQLFEGVKIPYTIALGTSSSRNPQEAFNNLINHVNYLVIYGGYVPIGGIATSSTHTPSFYQAMLLKSEMTSEDKAKLKRNEQKIIDRKERFKKSQERRIDSLNEYQDGLHDDL